jgi:hypothetical protein
MNITVISRNLETTPQSFQMMKLYQAHEAAGRYHRNERSKARFLKPEERLPVTPCALSELSFIFAAPSRYR